MGKPPLAEQREALVQLAPDLLKRLDELEASLARHVEVEEDWVLEARIEIGREVVRGFRTWIEEWSNGV